MHMHSSHRGFTLIELAIVLVIIGLVAGGIAMGSNMIRSAEVQSVGADYKMYNDAVRNFKAHYHALPGDMASATNQWGVLAGDGNDATCQETEAINTTATCNGNDDGIIFRGAVDNDERFRAWQHLANAEMIAGPYTGRSSLVGTFETRPGVNVPASKIAGAAYRFVSIPANCDPCGEFYAMPGTLYFELRQGSDLALNPPPPLTAQEAFMIDKKFDDGKPGSGLIYGPRKSSLRFPDCTTSDDGATAEYDGTRSDTRTCVLDLRIMLD